MRQGQHIVALGIQIAVPDKHVGLDRDAAIRRNVGRHVGERPDDDSGIFRGGLLREPVYEFKLKSGVSPVFVSAFAVVFRRDLAALRTEAEVIAVVHLREIVDRRRVFAEFGAVLFDERAQVRPDDIEDLRIRKTELTAAVRLEMPFSVRPHRKIFGMILGVLLRPAVGEKRVRRIVGPGQFRKGEFPFQLRPPRAAPQAPGEIAADRGAGLRITAAPHVVVAHVHRVPGGEIGDRYLTLGGHDIRIVAGDEAEPVIGIALQKFRHAVRRAHTGIGENERLAGFGDDTEFAAHQFPGVKPRLQRGIGVADENAHPAAGVFLPLLDAADLSVRDPGKRLCKIRHRAVSPDMRPCALRVFFIREIGVKNDLGHVSEPERCRFGENFT